MSHCYIKTPTTILFNSIVEKDFTLSSSRFAELVMTNQTFLCVKDFLHRPLQRKDLGVEVGSLNYIRKSTHYFLRTKALQAHSYLPEITSETAVPIMPGAFVKMNLKKGDLIISKDSNIGEAVLLDKDYPNHMLSNALYKLPVAQKKYYLLAFIKHNIFREQLDFIVPKGVTIRHAKTLFLDCKIPIPNHSTKNTIKFIETLTQAIMNKEQLIKQRHASILRAIEIELLNNQKPSAFKFAFPTIQEIEAVGRLDTGLYSGEFKKLNFLISNYQNGLKTIKELGYKVLRGPNLAVSVIGITHYSNRPLSKRFYRLIQPTDLSNYGTVQSERYFGNINNIQLLKKGDILFGAEGNIGKVHIILDLKEHAVTNYHGMSITSNTAKLYEKCFVGTFFFCLRNKNFFDFYAVGGQGGSFGKEKTENLKIPNFTDKQKKEIALLYHNPNNIYHPDNFTLDNFLEQDNTFNKKAGIYELDKTAKRLKEILNNAIDDIAADHPVTILFQ